jgi:hypothetical protein
LLSSPGARRWAWTLGVGSVVMNPSAVRPCHPERSRGAEGAARESGSVIALSVGVRFASPKSELTRKIIAFGEGRGFHAPSLRLVSPRCAELRSKPPGVAVTALGESLMDAQPLVLRRASAHQSCSFSRSPQPNPAFERTRRQRVSFGVIVSQSPCRLVARPRRAAQRRR